MTHLDKITGMSSLRTRMLAAITATVLLLVATVILIGAARVRHMSVTQIQHESELLSDMVEAAVREWTFEGDVQHIQHYIDALVAARERNDFEVNVFRMRDDGADIIASNLPDNIEEADPEEYEDLLAAIAAGEPAVEVEDVSAPENEEERARANDPNHPDYYFPAGSRELSIITPLYHEGSPVGGVNIKLSLHYLDRELASMTFWALLALGAGCLVLLFLLTPYLKHRLLNPLSRLAREMYAFGTGHEIAELAPSSRRDEIGVLETEFYNMVARIRSAEALREELAAARAESEKHAMEMKLRQAQKMEALGTLAGGIAHDFNNILTPIIGFTQVMMESHRDRPDEMEHLDQVYSAGIRAQDLVKQILAFSRQSEEERAPLDMGLILKETVKLLRASIPAGIEIVTHVDRDMVVLGNATHIHQILLNLATNAAHAMGDGKGRLEIALRAEDIEWEQDGFSGLAAGRYIRLTVTDTGAGIPDEAVDRLFEPYFTTKGEGEGTGLGLAVVHGIVEEMGGRITFDTERGKGTTFRVYLPSCEPGCLDHVAAIESTAVPVGVERVLVVDDEAPVAALLRTHLTALGYDVVMANNPEDAMALAVDAACPVDLIISDIAMPRCTGVDLARQLSDRGVTVPIILCSGYTGGINLRAAGAAGIRGILTKPIDKAKLAEAVRDALNEREAA